MNKDRSDLSFKALKFIGAYAKPYGLLAVLSAFASVLKALIDVAVGYVIKNMTDSTLNNQFQNMPKLIGIVCILALLGIFAKFTSKYFAARFGLNTVRALKKQVTDHISDFPVSTIEDSHSGHRISRLMNDASAVKGFLMYNVPGLIYNPIVFIVTLTFMMTINWKLSLYSIIIMPFALFLSSRLSKPYGTYYRHIQENSAKALSITQDAVSGIVMEKVYSLSEVLFNKYNEFVTNIMVNKNKSELRQALLTPLGMLMRLIPFLVCISYGGYLALNSKITTGSLFSSIFLMHFLIEPLSSIPEMIAQIRQISVSAERINELLDEPVERTNGNDIKPETPDTIIKFEDIFFKYCNDEPVFNGLSFSIPTNSTVALVGHSGCGKSTILKLLCGFYRPSKGSIKLYGTDMNELSMKDIRRMFSLMSQDTYLFPVSVYENISYGKPDAKLDDVINACKLANAHDFIRELPEGYNTLVGERGVKLSGGQRQRIAIARAILKDSPVILLDEPTSALDSQSEYLVQEAMENCTKGRTVLIVAHRLSTIKNADLILVIDQGVVAEVGTHNELLLAKGIYNQLYNRQLENTSA